MESRDKHCSQFKVLSIDNFVLPTSLQISIDKIVKNEGYVTREIQSRSISAKDANFMANLYEVDVKGTTADGEKETNIFIKNKIEDSKFALINTEECYNVENFFYRELSKIYDDMQIKANVPSEERYLIVKSYDASNPNAIVLENLDKKGYTTLHRMETPPLAFTELSIQQLARFHGLSWVIEKQHPEYFAKKIKTMRTNFKFGKDYQDFIDQFTKYTEHCVDEELKPKLEKLKSRMLHILRQRYTENSGIRCCLCHGDYKISNILVKKDGDNITEVIPVDYQLLYYGCPIMDFHFFMVLSTDSDFREKHLDNLKALYHNTLGIFLKYFDMDVNLVYPRCEFEAQYKERLDFGLITGLLMAPLLFSVDEHSPDINGQEMSSLTVSPDRKMDERVKGVLDDFHKWGVL